MNAREIAAARGAERDAQRCMPRCVPPADGAVTRSRRGRRRGPATSSKIAASPGADIREVIADLNPVLRGWGDDFLLPVAFEAAAG